VAGKPGLVVGRSLWVRPLLAALGSPAEPFAPKVLAGERVWKRSSALLLLASAVDEELLYAPPRALDEVEGFPSLEPPEVVELVGARSFAQESEAVDGIPSPERWEPELVWGQSFAQEKLVGVEVEERSFAPKQQVGAVVGELERSFARLWSVVVGDETPSPERWEPELVWGQPFAQEELVGVEVEERSFAPRRLDAVLVLGVGDS
jgi:hypothetical protein